MRQTGTKRGHPSNFARIRLWEAGAATPTDSTPQELPLNRHSAVRALAFHPSEPCLAIGDDDGSLELWRLQLDPKGRVRAEVLQNPAWSQRGPVRALAWHPDGDALVYGNESGSIGLVPTTNLKSGFWEESHHLFAHSLGVTALVFGQEPAWDTYPAWRSWRSPTRRSGQRRRRW
jgi:WD40 repeat protein